MDTGTLFKLNNARQHSAEIDEWLSGDPAPLFEIARRWFSVIRDCGEDVTETIHDGCPTACVGDAAFAYVNVFKSHASVGFYAGSSLDDPAGLLEGSGKRMRHVKLRLGEDVEEEALRALIACSYTDVKERLGQ